MPKNKKLVKKEPAERDSVYFLKLVLYFVLGCLWISAGGDNGLPIPIGLIFGVILASRDHFTIDRKIEFVVLLFAVILSYIAPIGFVLNIG